MATEDIAYLGQPFVAHAVTGGLGAMDYAYQGQPFVTNQVPVGYVPPVTVAALCLNSDGSLTYRPAATESDKKIYMNTGQLFARLSAIGGDKLVALSNGGMVAA